MFYVQSFYVRSFYVRSLYVRYFSTFRHSTFGHSTFGHSIFGQSTFGPSTFDHSIFGQSTFGHSTFVHGFVRLGIKDISKKSYNRWASGRNVRIQEFYMVNFLIYWFDMTWALLKKEDKHYFFLNDKKFDCSQACLWHGYWIYSRRHV